MIRELLSLDTAAPADSSMNGLQVANERDEAGRVAFAVDAGLEAIRRAVEWKADVLFVHHGLFWGVPLAVRGGHYRRLKALLAGDCALYAVHLPLDLHPELGNNAGIARCLGLRKVEPFGEHRGVKIGCKGELPAPLSLAGVQAILPGGNQGLGVLPFGPEVIRTVGIVAGGAAKDALQAIDQRLDLFITGEASHSVYHDCLEGRINVIFGGHYLTEVWGVKNLAARFASEPGLQTCFLDIPTGL